MAYVQCMDCGFSFAPEFATWTHEDFAREIYNADYVRVDPDALDHRPRINSQTLAATFRPSRAYIRHLDYGGGAGRLSELMRAEGWDSVSFDPFVDTRDAWRRLDKFQLITCFEVFEHVLDVHGLMRRLLLLLDAEGLVLVGTLVSDGHVQPGAALDWWYAAPRNGHISLFSRHSLALLAARHGLESASFSENIHLFWRGQFPRWARHLLKGG